MKDLNVEPAYLRWLAKGQRSAAKEAHDATSDTGFITDLWRTHGLWVGPGVHGFSKTADARKQAGEAMKKYSEWLADQLDQAAKAYANTDQQQGRDLDKQMQSDR